MNKQSFLRSIRPYITNPEVIDKEICHICNDCDKCRLLNCKHNKEYNELDIYFR